MRQASRSPRARQAARQRPWLSLLALIGLVLSPCNSTTRASPVIQTIDPPHPRVADGLAATAEGYGETWDIAALRGVAIAYYRAWADPELHASFDTSARLDWVPRASARDLKGLLLSEIAPFLISEGRVFEYDVGADDSLNVICDVRLARADSLTVQEVAEFISELQDLGSTWDVGREMEVARIYLRLVGRLIDLGEPEIERKIAALQTLDMPDLEKVVVRRVRSLLQFKGHFLRYSVNGFGEGRRLTDVRIITPQDGVDGWTALPEGRWRHVDW
jgi:hypothetical protein